MSSSKDWKQRGQNEMDVRWKQGLDLDSMVAYSLKDLGKLFHGVKVGREND